MSEWHDTLRFHRARRVRRERTISRHGTPFVRRVSLLDRQRERIRTAATSSVPSLPDSDR